MPYREHLKKDKKLLKLIAERQPYQLKKQKNIYLELCSSIISQQLSTKVARVINERFLGLFPTKKPTPQQIIEVPFEKLRSIGLSNAKANYVRNVCEFWIEEKVTDTKLHKMDDEELVSFLSRIKGIGRWTAEMILMFSLGREDVFAVDDLGIQKAMCQLYKIDEGDKKAMKLAMIKRAEKWIPYRTYACRYLWDWKDGV